MPPMGLRVSALSGVWGQCPQWGQGAVPLAGVWGQRPQRGLGQRPLRGFGGSAPSGVKGQRPLRGSWGKCPQRGRGAAPKLRPPKPHKPSWCTSFCINNKTQIKTIKATQTFMEHISQETPGKLLGVSQETPGCLPVSKETPGRLPRRLGDLETSPRLPVSLGDTETFPRLRRSTGGGGGTVGDAKYPSPRPRNVPVSEMRHFWGETRPRGTLKRVLLNVWVCWLNNY